MPPIGDTALATIIAAAIAGLVGWATNRSSARAQRVTAATSSRADVEKEAFERAATYYTGVIDRQNTEAVEDRAEIAGLKVLLAMAKGYVRILTAHIRSRGDVPPDPPAGLDLDSP
tara:strand:+ start:1576 stop:1923 length:348 start_codon:yes stop_codon:yes gene_type:complete